MSKLVQIVDENDQPLRAGTYEEAWSGLRHRIATVMVEDESGNVLLQRRSDNVATFKGCWDNSAAGHVDAGEDYEMAARRELKEELGLDGLALKEVAYYPSQDSNSDRKLNRFNKIYVVSVPHDTKFEAREREVAELRWFSRTGIGRLIAEHPDKVCDGLIATYNRLYK